MINAIKNYFLKRKYKTEYQVLDLVKRKFPNLKSILEAGGHNGKDTLRLNKYWPDAQIYVFEPEPSMFNQLEKTVEGNSKIKAYQLALSDKAGILEFHKSSGGSDASSSLLKPKEHLSAHPTVYFDDVIKVNVANLDNWCKESNIATIDFMWLDMQGNEINVLKSCPTILSKTCAVYTEVSLIETYEGVVLYPEFKQFMEKNGFKVFIEYLPWKDMGNVLFIRQELI